MRVLALDMAGSLGFAYGELGKVPKSGSFALKGSTSEAHAGDLGAWLYGEFAIPDSRPQRIVVEAAMEVAASRSAVSTKSQLLLHGALHGFAGAFGIPVIAENVNRIRKHVCGRSSALPRMAAGSRRRTPAQIEESSKATKRMVLQRVITLGYLPKGVIDTDRSDAVAVFIWAELHLARKVPRLVLT